MSYIPPRKALCGLSVDVAELYGKPHIGAFYVGRSADSNRLEDDARCAICVARATNAHHLVPRSKGRTFELAGHVLRSPLFALCGSGTTGCHDGFHGGARFKARWVWMAPVAAEAWWSGDLLIDLDPHDPALFELGCYRVSDSVTGKSFEVRHG